MFDVAVETVTATSARLAVLSCHPDSGPPQATSTFALMLVFDPIRKSGSREMARYEHLASAPLAAEMDVNNYLDPAWMRANAKAYIARTKRTKDVLEVWPTDPAWIAHLREGMAWDTAAYSSGPGAKVPARTPTPRGVARSQRRDEGFRIGKPTMTGSRVRMAYFACFGATRYVADPVHDTPEAIRAAIMKLAGEPVLVVPKRGPTEIGTLLAPTLEHGGQFFLYHETASGHDYHSVDVDELTSLGRAWLARDAPPPAKKPRKKSAR